MENRPILRGRDIKRYGYNWANLWLINTHNGIRGKLERVHIEDYPAIKAHLDQYWDRISKRADKGDTPYNLRNCAYLEDFSKPKIIFQEIVQDSQFCLDKAGNMFCNDTCRIIVGKNIEYLIHILNSKLFFFAVKRYYGGGLLGGGVRMKHTFFLKFHCINNLKELQHIAPEDIDKFIYNEYKLSSADHSLYTCDFEYKLQPCSCAFLRFSSEKYTSSIISERLGAVFLSERVFAFLR